MSGPKLDDKVNDVSIETLFSLNPESICSKGLGPLKITLVDGDVEGSFSLHVTKKYK